MAEKLGSYSTVHNDFLPLINDNSVSKKSLGKLSIDGTSNYSFVNSRKKSAQSSLKQSPAKKKSKVSEYENNIIINNRKSASKLS